MIKKFIKENPLTFLFSSIQISYNLATSLVIPFFSIILLKAGWSTRNISYFFSLFLFIYFLISPTVGKLSDKIGRKKLIQLGLIYEIFFFLINFFFIEKIELILILRIFDAIAAASIIIVLFGAFENSIKEKRGFLTGIFLSLATLGTLLGPIIAGFISKNYNNSYLFLISAFFYTTALFLLTYLPENKTKNKTKLKIKIKELNPFIEIKHFFTHKKLKAMAILGIIMSSKNQFYVVYFPIFIIQILKFNEIQLGILLAIPVFFHIFQIYFGKIADNISSEFGVLLGVFLVSSSFLFFPYMKNFYSLCLLFIIFGIGSSIWNVNAWTLMGNIAKEKNLEGEIIGTYTSISHFSMSITLFFSSYILNFISIAKTLQILAILIIITNIFAYFYLKPIFHQNINYFKKFTKLQQLPQTQEEEKK